MEIIAHRGEWTSAAKRAPNSLAAFNEALSNGFGIEVDIRDRGGDIAISHDAAGSFSPLLKTLLSTYRENKYDAAIAFNIKADGLQAPLAALIKEFEIKNYFVFDMSVPDTLGYKKAGLNYYARSSEYEPSPQTHLKDLYETCAGVWVDQFAMNEAVYKNNLAAVKEYLRQGKQVCFVSPELHIWGRENNLMETVWRDLKDIAGGGKIQICTDYPQRAKEFFNGQN